MKINKVTLEAIADASALRITYKYSHRGKSVEKILRYMLHFSSPFTHTEGNRRFGEYLFDVQDGELKSVLDIYAIGAL